MTSSTRWATLTKRRKSCRFRSHEQHPIISKLWPLTCLDHTGHGEGSDVEPCLWGTGTVPLWFLYRDQQRKWHQHQTHFTRVVFCSVPSDPEDSAFPPGGTVRYTALRYATPCVCLRSHSCTCNQSRWSLQGCDIISHVSASDVFYYLI